MIDIKFKPCCDDCKNRKIYTKESKMYVGSGVYDLTTIIGCEHEEVCKEYLGVKERVIENVDNPFIKQLPKLIISGKREGNMIASIVYEGTSDTKAREIYNILEEYRVKKLLIPIDVDLTVNIYKVIPVETELNSLYRGKEYKIAVEAILVGKGLYL